MSVRIAAVLSFIGLAVLLALVHVGGSAWADEGKQQSAPPSLLVVDAGLGDYELAGLHWLGENPEIVAEDSGRVLTTTKNPVWWEGSSGTPPATFLLGRPTAGATTADDIIWALDEIRASGAEPRTFVLAMGETGLVAREYAQDLASQKQSGRADLVGLGFCGTPQNGYSAMAKYPEQKLWARLAESIGKKAEDLDPQSAYLKELNQGTLPATLKVLTVTGEAGDLGFGTCDGAGTAADFELASTVTDQVIASKATVTAGQQLNLTSFWEPFTSQINYPDRTVDPQLTERLSAIASYETSDDVPAIVRDFYNAWFADGCPVTHNSNVLLLDLSGSMVESLGDGDKLFAAKEAARQYLQAMQACSELPQSAPMDVAVFGFNEVLTKVAEGYDQGSIAAIETMAAQKETNISIALNQAVETLKTAPTCASKRVLLLSDGEATRGETDEEMLSGVVKQAADAGIVIDAIGFGNVGESDAGFLKEVAAATGGTYYQADDTYSLKVNFLKSYYSSLGLSLVDEEMAQGSSSQSLGTIDSRTSALQVGVVCEGSLPSVTLVRDGAPLDASQYTVKEENGLVSLQCIAPPEGEYSLELKGLSGAAHVFAVKQQGIAHPVIVAGEQQDYSLFLIIGVGVLLVAALVVVVLRTRRKPKQPAVAQQPESAGTPEQANKTEGTGI